MSKLVGNYASGSDEEDGTKSLDAKVEEFMKVIIALYCLNWQLCLLISHLIFMKVILCMFNPQEVDSSKASDDTNNLSCGEHIFVLLSPE